MLPGVYLGKKKDGSIYYRASITYKKKHISLGSFQSEEEAFNAYLDAEKLVKDMSLTVNSDYSSYSLPFNKIITLLNFRDNDLYFKTPIYVYPNYFEYYLGPELALKFDSDDLFYYSGRTISVRKGHLFVADYGMQVTLLSRYGVKNYAIKDKDYRFVNGDDSDYRYSNIEVLNPYYGVEKVVHRNRTAYKVVLHIRSNYVIGYYEDEIKAAIAYNKAVDMAKKHGIKKAYPTNFVDGISNQKYASVYSAVKLPESFLQALLKLEKK